MISMSYVGVNLPKELMDQVDHEIQHGKQGYKSRSEFIKEATRQLIMKIQGVGNGDNPILSKPIGEMK